MAVDTNTFCKILLASLPEQRPANYIAPNQGLLSFLVSDQNRNANGFKAEAIDAPPLSGRKRKMRVRHWQRASAATYNTAVTDSYCEPGTPKTPFASEYEITDAFKSKVFQWDFSQMREFCEGKNEVMMKEIASEMQAFRAGLNRKYIQEIIAKGLIGGFAHGVAGPKTIPLFESTSLNRINPVGEITIKRDMSRAELASDQMVKVGAGLLESYMAMKNIACCNDKGFNMGLMNEVNGYVLDTLIDSELGSENNMWVLRPGAIQIMQTTFNSGDFMVIDGQHSKITIPDNFFPFLVYDWYIKFNHCLDGDNYNTTITAQFISRTNLWGYPTDLYETSDALFGVTDAFHYETECADDSVCDITIS